MIILLHSHIVIFSYDHMIISRKWHINLPPLRVRWRWPPPPFKSKEGTGHHYDYIHALFSLLSLLLPIVHGPWFIVRSPWTMDHGPWTMVHGPWTMDHGLWSMHYGPYKYSLAGSGSPTGGAHFQNPYFENISFGGLEQAPLAGEHISRIPILNIQAFCG